MNIEKIEVKGHYVWVDKDAEIKEGNYVYQPMTIQVYKTNRNDNSDLGYKIIAASPELNLEGFQVYFNSRFKLCENDSPKGTYGLDYIKGTNFNTPEEAKEAALLYCLTNLIK